MRRMSGAAPRTAGGARPAATVWKPTIAAPAATAPTAARRPGGPAPGAAIQAEQESAAAPSTAAAIDPVATGIALAAPDTGGVAPIESTPPASTQSPSAASQRPPSRGVQARD